MSDNMTTTQNGFRVEDVTFRRARRQSEIDSELIESGEFPVDSQVPVSLTPEQVKKFYANRAETTRDMHEKALYMTTIKWIDDLFTLRKENVQLSMELEKIKRVQAENEVQDIKD